MALNNQNNADRLNKLIRYIQGLDPSSLAKDVQINLTCELQQQDSESQWAVRISHHTLPDNTLIHKAAVLPTLLLTHCVHSGKAPPLGIQPRAPYNRANLKKDKYSQQSC